MGNYGKSSLTGPAQNTVKERNTKFSDHNNYNHNQPSYGKEKSRMDFTRAGSDVMGSSKGLQSQKNAPKDNKIDKKFATISELI